MFSAKTKNLKKSTFSSTPNSNKFEVFCRPKYHDLLFGARPYLIHNSVMEESITIMLWALEYVEDDEMLLISNGETRVQRSYALPRAVYQNPFTLDDMTDGEVYRNFRFSREELQTLAHNLLPEEGIRSELRHHSPPLCALCVVLRRLAYPARWSDLSRIFRKNIGWLSSIYRVTILFLFKTWSKRLSVSYLSTNQKIERFKNAISEKCGSILTRGAIGFLDGTWLKTCRPLNDQESIYSGYHSAHGLAFQGIAAPDGLIRYFSTAYAGRLSDFAVYLRDNLGGKTPQDAYVISDSIYRSSSRNLSMWKTSQTQGRPDRRRFNRVISSVRVSVEWAFGQVARLFPALQFWRDRGHCENQLVGVEFSVAVHLANIHVCFYGSQIGDYFEVEIPKLEEYLAELKET